MQTIDELPELENLPVGQISPIECKMLYWLTSSVWTGQADVVEVGSLFGKSTVCLARGMRDNPAEVKRGKLHAFDKWSVDDENAYMMVQLRAGFRGSFRVLFDKNTREVDEWIVPHEGDTRELPWTKPIEILFLDCSTDWDFHEMLFKKFYSCLRRGSVLVHQDYFFYRSYYLPVMMDRLGEYFALLGNADTSVVFQMTKPIPKELFDRPLVQENEIVVTIERYIEAYGGINTVPGAIIGTMLVYFHNLRGDKEKAQEWTDIISRGDGMSSKAVSNNLKNAGVSIGA